MSHTTRVVYACSHCDYVGATKSRLTIHTRTHTGQKPYVCNFEGCNYAASVLCSLITHKRTHTGERPYVCKFEGCGFAATQSQHLAAHKRTHTGEKPYVCDFEGCAYATTQSSHLADHKRAMHSTEGMQRQKRRENKVITYLQQFWSVEREVNVAFNCFATDGKFARLDGVLHFPERGLTVILEVDEDQHVHYMVACDARRMMDVTTALMCSTTATPHLLWVRFNPDAFAIDGVKQRVKLADKLQALHHLIATYQPTMPVAVCYLFYDMLDGEPVVCADADYDASLRELLHVA